jgi:hypothetical protein
MHALPGSETEQLKRTDGGVVVVVRSVGDAAVVVPDDLVADDNVDVNVSV